MNITTVASNLNWKTNNKGVWKALIKDLEPNGAVEFSEGYTASVSGRIVSVSNSSAPTGVVTYASELTNAVSTEPLYGAGSVSDSLEAVAGDKTVRMGSVDLGTIQNATLVTPTTSYPYGYLTFGIIGKAGGSNMVCPGYIVGTLQSQQDKIITANTTGTTCFIVDSRFVGKTVSQITTMLSGVMLYYELAEPTISTETPQSLSLTTGDDTLSGGSFDAAYEGTDYSIPLIRNCKYIFRDGEGNETLLTGSTTDTSKNVVGGQDKLINLTHWFGRNREPSIEDFYKLYPTWKNYDIPYDQGSVLNYKGTGVETIGFNAYDHATGTAFLLGGNKYQICGTFTSVSYVDVFGNTETVTLDSAGCFTPINDGTLTVTGGNGTDTCVHLVWSGYKNHGEPEYKWEPFTRNVKEFPISTYFPDGMNGIEDTADELTSEQKIVRYKVVDAGTLTWTKHSIDSSYPYGYLYSSITDKAAGETNVRVSRYSDVPSWTFTSGDKVANGSASSNYVYIVDSSLLSLSDTELATALTGCLIYYELATPVVTQLDQPLNLAYPVNDFGTEHSLPQNTTTLVTTDLKALIKYNTDYMRMNSQLSGIFPTVKSLARQEQDGHIMKKDDTAPNATVGNAFNLIDRNAEGTERQFSFDTAGGTQDITDGTAVAKKSMGTTLNLNQLVKDSVEKTESSATGVLELEDAVAGDALALKMTAPRSVVVNQLVQNGNMEGTTNISVADILSATASNNVLTVTTNGTDSPKTATINFGHANITTGHAYLLVFTIKKSVAGSVASFVGNTFFNYQYTVNVEANTSYTLTQLVTSADTTNNRVWICPFNNYTGTEVNTAEISKVMLVDLTQCFNGDTSLIDSIQTWDDLVAYDPRFVSYVEYNTGEVVGVTPTVKVCGKNLFNKDATYESGYYVYTTGVFVPLQNVKCFSIPVQGGRTYTRSSTTAWGGSITFWKDSTFLSGLSFNSNTTFTVPINANICKMVIANENENGNFQIELGSSATTYEPYHDGGTAQAPAPLFAVGNAADEYEAVSGVTTHKMASVDMGELSYTDYNDGTSNPTAYPHGYTRFSVSGKMPNATGLMCAKYTTVGNLTSGNKTITGTNSASSTNCYIVDSSLIGKTGAEIKSLLSGTTLYYELAAPTTSQSTPTQISLQAGDNTAVQTDGGRTLGSLGMGYDGTDYVIATKSARKYVRTVNGTTELVTGVSSVSVRGGRDNLIDLTRMFGSGLEPGTLDAFYSLFPAWRGYKLPYNEGSLLNFKGTGLKSVGFNQFSGMYSEEGKYLASTGALTADTSYSVTDYLRAIPGQTYRLTAYGNAPSLCWYTYDKTLISGTSYGHASTWQEDVFTAPANAYWVRFSVYMPREAETCFYFQWSGPRNGDYEPYWDYTRPIPTLTYFPEGMNGRGSTYDEINSRQAVKRFGVVDLGTLEWIWTNASAGLWHTSGVKNSVKKVTVNSAMDASLLSDRFVQVPQGGTGQLTGASNHVDEMAMDTTGVIYFNNGSTTESPTGTLVYELATPVVTNFSDEVNMSARISDYGTEECLPVNGYDPVTTPFRGMVLYQDDYARTITKLPENYQSQSSMDNLLALIGPLLNGTITATFDSANQVYTYQFTPNA